MIGILGYSLQLSDFLHRSLKASCHILIPWIMLYNIIIHQPFVAVQSSPKYRSPELLVYIDANLRRGFPYRRTAVSCRPLSCEPVLVVVGGRISRLSPGIRPSSEVMIGFLRELWGAGPRRTWHPPSSRYAKKRALCQMVLMRHYIC